MAEINIRLVFNLETGKKDIFVDFESDPDALPFEHEEAHRDIVRQLIGQNVVAEGEVGEVVISRVEPQRAGRTQVEESAEEEPQAESQ